MSIERELEAIKKQRENISRELAAREELETERSLLEKEKEKLRELKRPKWMNRFMGGL